MTQALTSLAQTLYDTTQRLLKHRPDLAPWRHTIGFQPRLSDADLVTLALTQAMLGHTNETRWLRYARTHLTERFPYLPQQSGYNKHLRKAAGLIRPLIRYLATDTSVWTDNAWVIDSTPVECARSRETVKRSDLAGWTQYGYCASHSRFFWGLRLHLVCTLSGLPVAFALTGAKTDERTTLIGMFENDPGLLAQRPGQVLIADKNYYGRDFEQSLAQAGLCFLRPARKGESSRAGAEFFRPLRQVIESINQTFKGQLDLEQHGGRPPGGVIVRVLQRLLALTAAVWHNDHRPAGPTFPDRLRSLTPWNYSSRCTDLRGQEHGRREGRPVRYGTGALTVIAVMRPHQEHLPFLTLSGVGADVDLFVGQGAVEMLHLAVGL